MSMRTWLRRVRVSGLLLMALVIAGTVVGYFYNPGIVLIGILGMFITSVLILRPSQDQIEEREQEEWRAWQVRWFYDFKEREGREPETDEWLAFYETYGSEKYIQAARWVAGRQADD